MREGQGEGEVKRERERKTKREGELCKRQLGCMLPFVIWIKVV